MPDSPDGPLLAARGLGYQFADGGWAFRNVDLDLVSSEIRVLAGRNGAGKTLLAKNLAGLLRPSEGAVLYRGADFRTLKNRITAGIVGYVFQDARLQTVGETVEDDLVFGPANLGLGKDEARERAEHAMESCGIERLRRSLVHTLSGGELRLLAIAGLVAMRPAAIILDEPFANLDRDGVVSVLRVIKGLADEGMAVLVITHEVEKVLALASVFMVMDRGGIVLSGDPASVLSAGIETFGLRDPFKTPRSIAELSWLT
jgi:energy-coupling factor transporter ATP-binding protein EcfA2